MCARRCSGTEAAGPLLVILLPSGETPSLPTRQFLARSPLPDLWIKTGCCWSGGADDGVSDVCERTEEAAREMAAQRKGEERP